MCVLPGLSSSGSDGLVLLTKQAKKKHFSSFERQFPPVLYFPFPKKKNNSCFGPLGPTSGAGQSWEGAGLSPLVPPRVPATGQGKSGQGLFHQPGLRLVDCVFNWPLCALLSLDRSRQHT